MTAEVGIQPSGRDMIHTKRGCFGATAPGMFVVQVPPTRRGRIGRRGRHRPAFINIKTVGCAGSVRVSLPRCSCDGDVAAFHWGVIARGPLGSSGTTPTALRLIHTDRAGGMGRPTRPLFVLPEQDFKPPARKPDGYTSASAWRTCQKISDARQDDGNAPCQWRRAQAHGRIMDHSGRCPAPAPRSHRDQEGP